MAIKSMKNGLNGMRNPEITKTGLRHDHGRGGRTLDSRARREKSEKRTNWTQMGSWGRTCSRPRTRDPRGRHALWKLAQRAACCSQARKACPRPGTPDCAEM